MADQINFVTDFDNADDFQLKHTPNIKVIDDGDARSVVVTVGLKGIKHPQTPEHHIEWVELYADDVLFGKVEFAVDDADPKAEFDEVPEGAEISAILSCNLHGLWKATA
ncbi:MAG: class II SORL domain-containing protein [Coriobacteriales bacterium]|jgi:superoxide reductase|nr:class II SORL domain-containing protein [Coriobacteriales bacterium]